MGRPNDLEDWVVDDDPAKITDPGSSKKLAGFLYLEKVAMQHLNWLFNRMTKWINHFDDGLNHFAPGEADIPDMTVIVNAGRILSSVDITTIAKQTSATITAPVTNPRIDRIVRDRVTGIISIIAGTEAASPTAANIPFGVSPVCKITLATSTTEITDPLITDERSINSNSSRGCFVKPIGTFSVPDSTSSWIPFADEEYDTDGIHDTVINNDRLTVPVGVTKVKITGQIQFSSTSTVGSRTLEIVKNISTLPLGVSSESRAASTIGNTPCNVFSAILEVTAGDYFRLRAYQDSGGALNTFTTSWFAMEIIE